MKFINERLIIVALCIAMISTGIAEPPTAATPTPTFSEAATQPILPPVVPWNGKSRALAVAKNDPWITPAEKTDFRTTPSYDETMAWLRKLTAAAPELKIISLGKSPEGRDI